MVGKTKPFHRTAGSVVGFSSVQNQRLTKLYICSTQEGGEVLSFSLKQNDVIKLSGL